jgi:hypothetical protein
MRFSEHPGWSALFMPWTSPLIETNWPHHRLGFTVFSGLKGSIFSASSTGIYCSSDKGGTVYLV